jgi:quercetin dioxygenase-like cupin family protein
MRVVAFTSATLLAIVLGVGSRALGGQPDDVVFHDMATIAKAPYGPYPDARAVLTETCSIAIATLPPRWRQTPHHHTQEQVTIGREGPVSYIIDGIPHELGAHGAGLPPPDVEHGMANDSDGPAVIREYQPVLRREWLPPHPQVPPQPQAPQAQRTSPNVPVTVFWDLSRVGASVDVAIDPTSRERLVFVLNGHATVAAAEVRRIVGPEMLMEVRPAARNVVMRSQRSESSMIVVFDANSR